ncbi:MAG: D-alanyl-D-alanine carboxypeptidase family protein [Bacilli bacterium]
MKKILFCLGLFMILNQTINAESLELAKNAKSAILIEASTGEIIFEKNSHEKLNPASMTKMMSMLLIIEAIENNVIKWDDMITVSNHASSMGGSQILLETGEKMSVSDLFKGVSIASGNDAVVALAEKIAGTEEAFVKMMNQKAQKLKLKSTNFKNPHGLDITNHYSSAYDMSIIAKELVKHKKVLEYTVIYEDYLRENTNRKIWLVNTNKLVRFYEGVDGLKTGYTKEAGYCLTATAQKENMRLIAVVMGEPDSSTRNSEVTSLFDYAYAQYEINDLLLHKPLKKHQINQAKKEMVKITPLNPVTILNKKIDKEKKYSYDIQLKNIKAPVKKGEIIGMLTIKENNKKIRTINLTVEHDIAKANILELYFRHLKKILTGEISFK